MCVKVLRNNINNKKNTLPCCRSCVENDFFYIISILPMQCSCTLSIRLIKCIFNKQLFENNDFGRAERLRMSAKCWIYCLAFRSSIQLQWKRVFKCDVKLNEPNRMTCSNGEYESCRMVKKPYAPQMIFSTFIFVICMIFERFKFNSLRLSKWKINEICKMHDNVNLLNWVLH